MDQPTFDGVNTYVVAAGAREAGLKVSLSGLGADELLDGYGMGRRVRLLTAAARHASPIRAHVPMVCWTHLVPAKTSSTGMDGRTWGRGRGYTLLRSLFLPEEVARLLPTLEAAHRRNGDRALTIGSSRETAMA